MAKKSAGRMTTKAKKAATKKVARRRSPAKRAAGALVDLQNCWPQERDFMERPDRLRYVRKLLPDVGCVFCNTANAGASEDTLCLFEDDKVMVVLNKYPYNTGHLMVMPTRHCGDLLDLSEAEYAHIFKFIRRAVEVLKKEYEPKGFNIGLNHGAVAGAGIPEHLHWHIVPRWFGDTNFFPLIAETKVLPETLGQTYNRLKGYF